MINNNKLPPEQPHSALPHPDSAATDATDEYSLLTKEKTGTAEYRNVNVVICGNDNYMAYGIEILCRDINPRVQIRYVASPSRVMEEIDSQTILFVGIAPETNILSYTLVQTMMNLQLHDNIQQVLLCNECNSAMHVILPWAERLPQTSPVNKIKQALRDKILKPEHSYDAPCNTLPCSRGWCFFYPPVRNQQKKLPIS